MAAIAQQFEVLRRASRIGDEWETLGRAAFCDKIRSAVQGEHSFLCSIYLSEDVVAVVDNMPSLRVCSVHVIKGLLSLRLVFDTVLTH